MLRRHCGFLSHYQARTAQLRGTPQPPTSQQDATESGTPSETHDVRVFSPTLPFYPFLTLNNLLHGQVPQR
jgi:hypothetical protein